MILISGVCSVWWFYEVHILYIGLPIYLLYGVKGRTHVFEQKFKLIAAVSLKSSKRTFSPLEQEVTVNSGLCVHQLNMADSFSHFSDCI